GNLYVVETQSARVGSIATDGRFLGETQLTPNTNPDNITTGPDGNLWITEDSGNAIARLDANTGQVSEFAVPTPNSGPGSIKVGPDGNLWFTEADAGSLQMINTNGTFGAT